MKEPKQKRSQQTRQRILRAGEKIFARKGFFQTNSKEITREAEVGIGSFYDYFPDKKALFLEILQNFRDRFLKAMETRKIGLSTESVPPEKIVKEMISFVFEEHKESPAFHNEAAVLRYKDPDIEQILEEWDAVNLQFIKELLESLPEKNQVEDKQTTASLILRTIEENVHFYYHRREELDRESWQRELCRMISRYLFTKD